jgi:hypothetical protein
LAVKRRPMDRIPAILVCFVLAASCSQQIEVFSKFVQSPSVSSLNLPYRWNFTIVDK